MHYEETWENPAGGHVPKHKCFYGALTCNGKTVVGCGLNKGSTVSDERIRLIHCRFRGAGRVDAAERRTVHRQRRGSSEADHAHPGGTGGMAFGGRLMAAHGLFQAGW